MKVGCSVPKKLRDRIRTIRKTVPDARLVGTQIFTSVKTPTREKDKHTKSFGSINIEGLQVKAQEKRMVHTTTHRIHSPEKVEDEFVERKRKSHVVVNPDEFTIYLMFSPSLNQHLIKYCKTERLEGKIRKIKETQPDAQLIARFLHRQPKEVAICNSYNVRSVDGSRKRKPIGSDTRQKHRDFESWTPEGIQERRSRQPVSRLNEQPIHRRPLEAY